MRPAFVVSIQTPKKFELNGLWFGAKRPRTAYIWVHGLGSSAFSKLDIAQLLAKDGAAVLTFNNRGHDRLSFVSTRAKKPKRKLAGGGAEDFRECADDIQGAINFARKAGARNIFLIGHSTGCQKSVYWASKNRKGVKGIILLAPVSDYPFGKKSYGAAKYRKALALARTYIRKGKQNTLLPQDIWPALDTAQRFLSLYTQGSVEEIFTYSQTKKIPRTLRKVRIPILALLAEKDEYWDRPAVEVATWFLASLKKRDDVEVVPKATHGFKGAERKVVSTIRRFVTAFS